MDKYDKQTKKFLKRFKKYVSKNFGPRCIVYMKGCAACESWAKYDKARDWFKM